MTITVTFACGHQLAVNAVGEAPPVCACGERQIARVKAPPPRFLGACQGPLATTSPLPAVPVAAAPGGTLVMK